MQKVLVVNNACEEGKLKSTRVQQFFKENGFVVAKDLTQADMIIFFACGLTATKEKHSQSTIRRFYAQKKPDAKLIVWGCLPKINPKALKEVYDGPIVGPKDLDFFEKLVGNPVVSIDDVCANTLIPNITLGEAEVTPPRIRNRINDFLWLLQKRVDQIRLPRRKWLFESSSFFIRVSEGCTENCTYCSEKPAWGGVKSRPMEKILKEFRLGLEKGYNRFFLVAADLGSYGIDNGYNPVDLLNEMVNIDTNKDYSIIINQMSPLYLKKLLPDLKESFGSGKIEALGCQVESGSNRILRLMGRRYKAEDWRSSMLRINKEFPFIRLSTHIMIGFPGETEEDFEATVRLLDFPLFIDWIGFFRYSSRPTVCASRLPGQVSSQTKEKRFIKIYRKYLYMYALNVALGNLRYIKSKV